MSDKYDVAIIGGGIIGLSTARMIAERWNLKLVVLETENELAAHQTGHNSGVIHSGLYYQPGSLKAKNCVEGREAMYRFCSEHGVPHDRCGKLVAAVTKEEVGRLVTLQARGEANGLQGVRLLEQDEIKEHEPHLNALAALLGPETGIVDFPAAARKYAELAQNNGAEIRTEAKVQQVHVRDELTLETTGGEVSARFLINCAGLQCDRVARMCGVDPKLRVVPFRGEYYELAPDAQHLVKNLIYPVPDPRFPFLGVHFTRMIHGGVEAGPNAVLAMKREGYRKTDFSLRDAASAFGYRGFWKMSWKFWRTGLYEMYRSFSKKAFVRDLRRLVPELRMQDDQPAGAGVRAQSLLPDGTMVDDFRFVQADRMIHVLNAPSPAATASISIGAAIADLAGEQFQLDA
ncbi:MAG: L-2-hydroxyglutarate oxidase [Planctomycetales bacterium]